MNLRQKPPSHNTLQLMPATRTKPASSLEKTRIGLENPSASVTSRGAEKLYDSVASKNTFLKGLDVSTSFLERNANITTTISPLIQAPTTNEEFAARSKSSSKGRDSTLAQSATQIMKHSSTAEEINSRLVSQRQQHSQLPPTANDFNKRKKLEAFNTPNKENTLQIPRSLPKPHSNTPKEDIAKREVVLPKVEIRRPPIYKNKDQANQQSNDSDSALQKTVEKRPWNIHRMSENIQSDSLISKNDLVIEYKQFNPLPATLDQPGAISKLINYGNNSDFQLKGNTKSIYSHKSSTPEPRELTNYKPPTISSRSFGAVYAYSASTNQGIIRDYNEDRTTTILELTKPNDKKGEPWPSCSYFGVFDGHGGYQCADFLKDNLHQYVIFSLEDLLLQ